MSASSAETACEKRDGHVVLGAHLGRTRMAGAKADGRARERGCGGKPDIEDRQLEDPPTSKGCSQDEDGRGARRSSC
jgi:hypothetical protein